MKHLLMIATMILSILSSCNEDKESTDLDGRQLDTVKLSTKWLTFNSQASTKEVTTEGDQWNMFLIMNEDTELDYSNDDLVITSGDTGKYENTPLRIEGDWFTVTRELKRITVNVKPNNTNKKRIVKIGVNDRNYFDRIVVEQSSGNLHSSSDAPQLYGV